MQRSHYKSRRKRYTPQDRFFHKAKEEGYRARSAYKLKEILERFRIIRPGFNVLDLGSAPGSFLQVISRIVGDSGTVVGIDLKEIEPFASSEALKNITTYTGDVFDLNYLDEILGARKFDTITSDLMPNTTGIRFLDQDNSVDLNIAALKVVRRHLKRGGTALFKIFNSNEVRRFLSDAKRNFRDVRSMKPAAVRETSKEIYIICMGYEGGR
jgi:23S rRNA (uridine2552-2'-O)-methyltransferase